MTSPLPEFDDVIASCKDEDAYKGYVLYSGMTGEDAERVYIRKTIKDSIYESIQSRSRNKFLFLIRPLTLEYMQAYLDVDSFLTHCVLLNRYEMMTYLLRKGISIRETELLYLANTLKMLTYLLRRGADPNFIPNDEKHYWTRPILYMKIDNMGYNPTPNECEIVRTLLEYGADPNYRRLYRGRAEESIMRRVMNKFSGTSFLYPILTWLLQCGCNPFYSDEVVEFYLKHYRPVLVWMMWVQLKMTFVMCIPLPSDLIRLMITYIYPL
jgi:hypothetical protein